MLFQLPILSFLLFPLLSLAAPTPTLVERATTTVSTVTPSDVVVIFEQYPTWSSPSWNYGALSRTNGNNARITLFTFYFANASPEWGNSNYQCKLGFKNPVVATGSKRAQLFSIFGNVTAGASWNSRPGRNQHLGTLLVKDAGQGEAIWEFGGTIPCPTTPYARPAFELVPVGDNDLIEWIIPENGIRVDVIRTD